AGLIPVEAGGLGRFGPLGLDLQVKGDVALAHARHNGLHLAPKAAEQIVAGCLRSQKTSGGLLLEDRKARRWLKTGQDGKIKYKRDGSPLVPHQELVKWLDVTFGSIEGLHRTGFARPRQESGGLSSDPEDWGMLVRCHRHLQAWSDLVAAPRVGRSVPVAINAPLRPHYEVLPQVRSREPDLEALRRLGGPELF